jgi:hypothetical protein
MSLSPNEETSIRFSGEWDHPLAAKLQDAWFDAIAMNYKLPDSIRYMEGMSGKKYRYLINNLVGSIDDARYLEIGSWKGSTAASAIYGNKCKALCIDNWADFLWGLSKENVRGQFETNVRAAAGDTCDFSYLDQDFRTVDYSNIGKFNVYMFDGPHSEQDQYDGIAIAQAALDDTFVLVIDDYNGDGVKKGTERALKDLNINVVAAVEIITRTDQEHPVLALQHSDWHNGYLIAVCSKV